VEKGQKLNVMLRPEDLRVDEIHDSSDVEGLIGYIRERNCFFACNVPGDVRQVNQAIDAAVQADEDTEVSDRLDFTLNTVALVVGFRELLPWVVFALFQAQGDTTTFFVDIQNHNFS
jgi:hypothetical protein